MAGSAGVPGCLLSCDGNVEWSREGIYGERPLLLELLSESLGDFNRFVH